MRNLIIGLILGVVAGVLLAVSVPSLPGRPEHDVRTGATPDPATPVRWRMASVFPAELAPQGVRAQKVVANIRAISDGDIRIEFHPPGGIVPAADVFDAVASGTVEAGFSSPGLWASKAPALQLLDAVPFGPRPAELLAWLRAGGGEDFLESIYHSRGIHSVICGVVPAAGGGWFTTPLNNPADLKAKRIAASGLAAKVLQTMGAVTRAIPPADIAAELEAKRLDGVIFSAPSADRGLGLQRAARHYYFPGWHQQAGLLELLVNLEKWKGLSDLQQTRIETACQASVADGLAEAEARQFGALKSLVVAGVDVKRWQPAFLDALHAAWRKVAAAEARKDETFREVLQSLRRFREDYGIWSELGYF